MAAKIGSKPRLFAAVPPTLATASVEELQRDAAVMAGSMRSLCGHASLIGLDPFRNYVFNLNQVGSATGWPASSARLKNSGRDYVMAARLLPDRCGAARQHRV